MLEEEAKKVKESLQEETTRLRQREREVENIRMKAIKASADAEKKAEAAAKIHGRAESIKAWEKAYRLAKSNWDMERDAQQQQLAEQATTSNSRNATRTMRHSQE